jgi:hypothetical protein
VPLCLCERKSEKILSAKTLNPTSDASDLERKIGMLVYWLYELTNKEVKVVDGGAV